MKKWMWLVLLLVLFLLPFSATAQELPGQELADELVEKTPSQAQDLAEKLGVDTITPEVLLSLEASDFLHIVGDQIKQIIKAPFRGLAILLVVIILNALLDVFKSSTFNDTLSGIFGAVASLAVSTVLLTTAVSCIQRVCETVRSFSTFLSSFVPVFAAAITASGQPMTGGVYSTFMFAVCQIIAHISSTVLLPLLGCYLALSFVGSINPSLKIGVVAETTKKTVSWIFALLLTVFVGMMSLQSLVATGSDNLAIKTGKFIIGSFVPVVGSTISEVFLSIQGCMKLMKTCIGGYGVLVAVLLFLPVLLEVLIWRVTIYLAEVSAQVLDLGTVSGILKAVGTVFTMLLAIILTFALLLIVSTTIMMVLGTG